MKVVIKCKGCGKDFMAYLCDHRIYCSIGCVPHEFKSKTHGDSYTRLHAIWCDMKTRCLCMASKAYPYYGGRGISIDPVWATDYLAFKQWALMNGYQDHLEIDRKDVNGNYEPSNCRWATRKQQMANTRKRTDGVTSRFKGVSWNRLGNNWRAQIVRDGKNTHIGVFDSEVDAARAYDHEAFQLRGEYALLNFPEPCLQGGASF